jgi:hypothetical protein
MTDVLTLTVQEQWKSAVRNLRAEGVHVRQNVMACCRGCITSDKLGVKAEGEPLAYTYGGQGGAYSWVDDQLFYRDSLRPRRWGVSRPQSVEAVYFNHSNGSGQRIFDAFTDQGFKVEWDGSDMSCVVIKF